MRSLFKSLETKCKNKHEVQIKLSKVQTYTANLASYLQTQWQFWQLTLKWLSGARAQDKTKQYYYCFLFFSYFIQLCDSREIHYLTLEFRVKLPLKTDIGFRLQFNVEFLRQIMNFPIQLYGEFKWKYGQIGLICSLGISNLQCVLHLLKS